MPNAYPKTDLLPTWVYCVEGGPDEAAVVHAWPLDTSPSGTAEFSLTAVQGIE
jgi:hypothetical protein